MAAPAPLKQKFVVVGAGPVGSLAALYAAKRGHDVEVYELRGGKFKQTKLYYYIYNTRTSMSRSCYAAR